VRTSKRTAALSECCPCGHCMEQTRGSGAPLCPTRDETGPGGRSAQTGRRRATDRFPTAEELASLRDSPQRSTLLMPR